MKLNEKWEYMYNLLVKYKEKYGNTDVPRSYVTEDGKKLGNWVYNQRKFYRDNKLYKKREDKLKLLEFRLDNIYSDQKWEYMYNLLVKYKEKYGDTEVLSAFVLDDGERLGQWVRNQRISYKNGNLSKNKEEKLRLLGFRFDNIDFDERWNYMFYLLIQYREVYGDTNVPRNYISIEGKKLGIWVDNQRSLYKSNKLSIDRIKKLNLIGFRFGNIDNKLFECEKIRLNCLSYNINYVQFKNIFDRLSYKDFIFRLYYILSNSMDIVNNNGNLNNIFGMDNDNFYNMIDDKSSNFVMVKKR